MCAPNMCLHVGEVDIFMFLLTYKSFTKLSSDPHKTSVRVNALHIADLKAHTFLVVAGNCADLSIPDFLMCVYMLPL